MRISPTIKEQAFDCSNANFFSSALRLSSTKVVKPTSPEIVLQCASTRQPEYLGAHGLVGCWRQVAEKNAMSDSRLGLRRPLFLTNCELDQAIHCFQVFYCRPFHNLVDMSVLFF